MEAELSKKCEELRHLFILQQRGRPIGSGGSSFHSGVGHSSGDSSNTANIACHFLPDRKGNDSPIIEARCKIYENISSIQGKII